MRSHDADDDDDNDDPYRPAFYLRKRYDPLKTGNKPVHSYGSSDEHSKLLSYTQLYAVPMVSCRPVSVLLLVKLELYAKYYCLLESWKSPLTEFVLERLRDLTMDTGDRAKRKHTKFDFFANSNYGTP